MWKWLRGTAGISSSSRVKDILSRVEDELRELLDLLESALLTFDLARFNMVPAKG
jgi:hypothetical protein